VRVLARTVDPDGRVVILNERGWAHILQEHEEMAHRDAIMTTVSVPEHRQPDPLPSREHYYRRNLGPSRWLFVVVHYEGTPAQIVTAYANRKDPPGWTAQ